MIINTNDSSFFKLLMERIKYWTDDKDILELFEKRYKRLIDEGIFEHILSLDIDTFVDNEYINNTSVISYDDLKSYGDDVKVLEVTDNKKWALVLSW